MDLKHLFSKEGIREHEDKIREIAEFFSVLSDPTRVKILFLLLEGEKCVGEIAKELGIDRSLVSHQLKVLRHLRLVKKRRVGKYVRYRIADDHILQALNVGFNYAVACVGL